MIAKALNSLLQSDQGSYAIRGREIAAAFIWAALGFKICRFDGVLNGITSSHGLAFQRDLQHFNMCLILEALVACQASQYCWHGVLQRVQMPSDLKAAACSDKFPGTTRQHKSILVPTHADFFVQLESLSAASHPSTRFELEQHMELNE